MTHLLHFLSWQLFEEYSLAHLAYICPLSQQHKCSGVKRAREGARVGAGQKMSNQPAYLNWPEHLRRSFCFPIMMCVSVHVVVRLGLGVEGESWILMLFSERGGLWLDSQRRTLNRSHPQHLYTQMNANTHPHTLHLTSPCKPRDKVAIIKRSSLSLAQ